MSHLYAKNNRYPFRPVILDEDYLIVTKEQMDIIAKAGITFYAKQPYIDKNEFVIRFDKSARKRIDSLIGVNKNGQ